MILTFQIEQFMIPLNIGIIVLLPLVDGLTGASDAVTVYCGSSYRSDCRAM
jgi:hypothetical protein